MRLSFLASHGGSSVRHIVNSKLSGHLQIDIGGIITNNRNSEIHRWCTSNQISVTHISSHTHQDDADKDIAICNQLEDWGTDFVLLSGYMKKIGPTTLDAFKGRILNIHPSLLPKYGGKGMYGDFVHEKVLQSGDSISGASVQYVTREYDEGPVIVQRIVPVHPDDDVASLKKRVMGIEGDLYIEAIESLIQQGYA